MKTLALTALASVLLALSCPGTAAAASSIDYIDMNILIVIYLHYDSGGSTTKDLTQNDIDFLQQQTALVREFYWRASGLNCNLNYSWSEEADLLIIGDDPGERTLTPDMLQDEGGGGVMLGIESVDGQTSVIQDLADAGIENEYAVVIVYYAFEDGDGYYAPYGAWCYYVDAVLDTASCMLIPYNKDWYEDAIIHEYMHALDFIDFVCWSPLDIQDPDDPYSFPYGIDGDRDFWFQNLNRPDPSAWMQIYSQWATPRTATDTDGDGVPDSGNLPITEQTLGTSAYSSDTDGDGLSDFGELYATYYAGSNPVNDGDTDDDGIGDNTDPFPLYASPASIEQGAPTVNGSIASGEWVEVTHFNGTDSDINATFYLRWDGTSLYFAAQVTDDQIRTYYTGDDSLNCNDLVLVNIDAGRDGFWFGSGGDTNYHIRFVPKGSSGVAEVGGYNLYQDEQNGEMHPLDTSGITARYTVNGNTYVIEAQIPQSVLPGMTIGSGNMIRICYGVQDLDDYPSEEWSEHDPFSGGTFCLPAFVEHTLTTAGGGTVVFSDTFDDTSWAPQWTTIETSWARVTTKGHDDSYSAEIDGNVLDSKLVSQAIDVSAAQTATVSFWWWIDGYLDTGEYLAFDVSTNGGQSWTEKGILRGNVDTEDFWHNASIEVDVSSASTLTLRFRGKMNYSNEDAYVDVVEVTLSGSGGDDTTPPTPNPMTWTTVPYATGPNSISMTATTASDPSGVEYYFECTAGGGHSSGWQDSTTYQDTGLNPNTQYTYRVKARDKSANQNETSWSSTQSATTDPASTPVELLGSWTSGTSHTKPSGTNRLLVFTVHGERYGTMNCTSVTYGGQAMTKLIERNQGSSGNRSYVATFILKEAGIAAATSSTFAVTWEYAPAYTGYSSVFLQNVNQSASTGANSTGGSDTATTVSTGSLATTNGDMVIYAGTNGRTGTYTPNNSFTEALEITMTSSDGTGGYKAATGATETPSVTHSYPSKQALVGFVVKHQ
ncbi:MAG: hypothetical protein JW889_00055 [Verrucomicrobia bacterium]|nr:hypothetical protein [Verrucomicrobiota bacterium]